MRAEALESFRGESAVPKERLCRRLQSRDSILNTYLTVLVVELPKRLVVSKIHV